jgi:broad specificity phosphatase PhoE
MFVTFLRHGQSEHNAGLTSFLDSRLTELGNLQSEAVARRFVLEGMKPSNCVGFVSPFQRTLQTLSPTVQATGIPSEVFTAVCEYFSERNDGYRCFEGLKPSVIAERFPWAERGRRFGVDEIWWPQKLESVEDLYARSESVRDHLIDSFFDRNVEVLIVSHADPIGRMIEAFLRVPPNAERPPWSENAGLTRLNVFSRLQPATVLLMNDTSHLDAQNLRSPV